MSLREAAEVSLHIKEIGSTVEVKEGISLWKIRKAVHEYSELLNKREKLQKRLIQVSGRDFDQEIAITKRLEEVEQLIEIINDAVIGEEILTAREATMVDHRIDGETLKEISEFFLLSSQRVNQILHAAYKKISDAAKARYE
ncbi:hypothetical protein HPT25_28120 [Bacillus sp. BRMEA1]|uniref:hypothetical protein n=1 Tax=Neobacillus endophyticus TaxID=2738405 RepID=UPI001567B010|nr:hypothetical protein [Neobacillus endophyticus]NRD81162.1 hypothetical protein [Neobacillus endophyticus]